MSAPARSPVRRRLAVAARFDAPCAARTGTSGSAPRHPLPALDTPDVEPAAIYHSVAADGRRIPLLKILLTNHCVYDCAYCPLRRSADVERARLEVHEVVRLTLDYHRRGLVDGLFLSAAVDGSADATMERLVAVARTLRCEHQFAGYVHLKVIPEANPELVAEAGRWADRVSVNVELARQADLGALAPGRAHATMRAAMTRLRDGIAEGHEADRFAARARWGVPRRAGRRARWDRVPRFAPAGQVTQLVVGADRPGVARATDADVLRTAESLYAREGLRRVYFGSYQPVASAGGLLVDAPSPAVRERRLYEADWLVRAYGFTVDELVPPDAPDLAPDVDPKLAWALRHPDFFPLDLNTAPREVLLRVPGLGHRTVERILAIRPWHAVRLELLAKLHVPVARVLPFVVTPDHAPTRVGPHTRDLRLRLTSRPRQLDLFDAAA
ncbi:putative DNA modification/repair radical SAM protein [Gemmatimonadetes bacterium T265]|nr:putative DNA modification/repair radical SAM protein [Gemmatimonadetes bacterium T265]